MKRPAFFLFFFAFSMVLSAAEPWEQLSDRVTSQKVVVQDFDDVRTRGVVRTITENELLLIREDGEVLEIPRSRVKKIQAWSRGTGARKAALWTGIVATVLFVGGAQPLVNESGWDDIAPATITMIALTTGAAAGIGAAAGGLSTVYKAPKDADEKASRFEGPFPFGETLQAGSSAPRATGLMVAVRKPLPGYLASQAGESLP